MQSGENDEVYASSNGAKVVEEAMRSSDEIVNENNNHDVLSSSAVLINEEANVVEGAKHDNHCSSTLEETNHNNHFDVQQPMETNLSNSSNGDLNDQPLLQQQEEKGELVMQKNNNKIVASHLFVKGKKLLPPTGEFAGKIMETIKHLCEITNTNIDYFYNWRFEVHNRGSNNEKTFLYFNPLNKCFRTKKSLIEALGGIVEKKKEEVDLDLNKSMLERRYPKKVEFAPKYSTRATKKKVIPLRPLGRNQKHTLKDYLLGCTKILLLIGAGVSTSAGLPDFRSKGTGLYAKKLKKGELPTEFVFDAETFNENKQVFYNFARKEIFPRLEVAQPTKAHEFIKKLEETNRLLKCYSQNIDGLEERGGIKKFTLCHGTLLRGKCANCNSLYSKTSWYNTCKLNEDNIPICKKCAHELRPDMVFFGEAVDGAIDEEFKRDCKQCDLVIVIGTSLSVAPMSEVIQYVHPQVPKVWINRTPPKNKKDFTIVTLGECDEICNKSIKDILFIKEEEEEVFNNVMEKKKNPNEKRGRKKKDPAANGNHIAPVEQQVKSVLDELIENVVGESDVKRIKLENNHQDVVFFATQ